jgi:hypothetical protein
VAGIGQQRQRVRCNSTDHLGNHVRGGQPKRYGEPPTVAGHFSGGRVMVVMLVIHLDSLLTTPSGVERFRVSSL